jgi:diguanylate cyclase (GGDEF)-like protein/PAS domain S-box-containing protein
MELSNNNSNGNLVIPYEDKAVLFQAAFDQSYSAIVITDASIGLDGPKIIYANLAFQKMTGYTLSELVGKSPKILQGPLTDQKVIEKLRARINSGTHFEDSTINYDKNGNPYNVEWSISPIKDNNGIIKYYISVQKNITSFIKAQKERHLLIRALNDSPDCVIITDSDNKIVFVNSSFETLTGYQEIEVIGKHPSFLWKEVTPEQKVITESRQPNHHLHFQTLKPNIRKNGTLFYVDQSIAHIQDENDNLSHHVSFSKDSTDRLSKENALRDLAAKDSLTDLLNRRSGEQLLIQYDNYRKYHGKPVCLVMLDIDNFKKINDTFGHAVGDDVLKTIGRTLQKEARLSDNVIRWGGEEFLIIVPEATMKETLALTERIRKSISDQVNGEVGQVTASFGVAEMFKDETTVSLINRADKALYKAKLSGKNCVRSDS